MYCHVAYFKTFLEEGYYGTITNFCGKKEKKSLGVCIPQHKKETIGKNVSKEVSKKSNSTNPTKELLVTKSGSFRVNGTYRVMDTIMIAGIVEEGIIRKRMKSVVDGRKLNISEVRQGNFAVESLAEGEDGTVFISTKSIPIINNGCVLSFQG